MKLSPESSTALTIFPHACPNFFQKICWRRRTEKTFSFSSIMEGKAGRIYITGLSIFWGRLLQIGIEGPKAEKLTGERGKYGITTFFLTICALPIMWALCSAPLKASE